jgi:spore germination protein
MEDQLSGEAESAAVTRYLRINERYLLEVFCSCSDIVFRTIRSGESTERLLVYVSSIVNEQVVDEHIIQPLTAAVHPGTAAPVRLSA